MQYDAASSSLLAVRWMAEWHGRHTSVPCELHGSSVSAIEFYITDQSGSKIDMQGSSFQATLQLFYADPIQPAIGTAGAEMDESVGLRDVLFRQ